MLQITKKQKDEFKAVKSLFDRASKLYEESNNELADHYENKAKKNVSIFVKSLNIDRDIIIDLIFDYDYTINLINN